MQDTAENIHSMVRERYGAVARARGSQGCCSPASDPALVNKAAIGYSEQEIALAGEANLGLGCGNPLALAAVERGMTVLDLGSGAGFDAFLVRERVGAEGRVIGVDMTDDMLALARANAQKRGLTNVEFRKGYIEALPVEDSSVDLVISNCVINLSPDKPAVFGEIARVLKPGGQFWISDIVLLRDLPGAIANDVAAYAGCVAGASLVSDYLEMLLDAGLSEVAIPQITAGASLLGSIAPEVQAKFDPEEIRLAAKSVVSARFHGRKPAKPAASLPIASCCGSAKC